MPIKPENKAPYPTIVPGKKYKVGTGEVSKPDFLYILEGEINKIKNDISSGFLRLGLIFKTVKDEELYKIEHDTFPSFVAQFGFSYSSVRSWIHIYDLYVLRLGRKDDELNEATWGQLQVINPVVESDPDEWIAKAKTLSRGDLINEVREAQGMEPMPHKEPQRDPMLIKSYEEYVASSPCIVCGKTPIEKAHFPHVKGRSKRPWHYIPLCHFHHIEDLHRHGVPHFMVTHRFAICDFFFKFIEEYTK